MIWLLPIVFACKNNDPVEMEIITQEPATAVEEQGLPVLAVTEPARGSFDSSGSGIVRGQVGAGQSGVRAASRNNPSTRTGDQDDVS